MHERGKVLITGGTSGLGRELVKQFLNKEFYVITTGRSEVDFPNDRNRFSLYRADFRNLGQTADIFREICNDHTFNYIIYNAGILSPAEFTKTDDGFEVTYQVNFLAHLLINEIIIRNHDPYRALCISAVTSMAYRVAEPEFKPVCEPSYYNAWKAYCNSKFYLALMCQHFSEKLAETNIRFFSFDPGIFSSKLYRTQSGIFRNIYQVGVNILKNPASSACVLADIMLGTEIKNGAVYDTRKRIRKLLKPEDGISESFWSSTVNELNQFLRNSV